MNPTYDFDNSQRTIRIDRITGLAWVLVMEHDNQGKFKSAIWVKIQESGIPGGIA